MRKLISTGGKKSSGGEGMVEYSPKILASEEKKSHHHICKGTKLIRTFVSKFGGHMRERSSGLNFVGRLRSELCGGVPLVDI